MQAQPGRLDSASGALEAAARQEHGLSAGQPVWPVRVAFLGTVVTERDGRWYTHHSTGRIADLLASRVSHLYFYGSRPSRIGGTTSDYGLTAPNLQVRPLAVPRKSIEAMRSPIRLLQCYRALAQGVDVVIVRGNPPLAWSAALFARLARVPIVFWVVGNTVAVLRAAERGYGGLLSYAAIAFAWAEQRLLRLAIKLSGGAVLANGAELARLFAGERTQTVVSTTISLAEFRERSDTCTGAEIRVLFVGFVRPEKGLEYLIRALPQVTAARQVRLTIVGTWRGFEAEKERLDALISALGLSDHVEWAGYAPFGPQLFAQLDRADVLVLPSLSEGTPRVLVEARARSVPVISTCVGGIPSSVAHGVDGLLVPPRDAVAIASALQQLIDDGELRRGLICAGRDRMRDCTVERFVDRILVAIRSAAGGSRFMGHPVPAEAHSAHAAQDAAHTPTDA